MSLSGRFEIRPERVLLKWSSPWVLGGDRSSGGVKVLEAGWLAGEDAVGVELGVLVADWSSVLGGAELAQDWFSLAGGGGAG